MTSKMQRLNRTHKMALRIAIKHYTKKKDWILAGELDDILLKSEGTNIKNLTKNIPDVEEKV